MFKIALGSKLNDKILKAKTIQKQSQNLKPQISVFGILLLAGLALFWGANWPGMKIALAEISPLWFRTICLSGGGIGLLIIARITSSTIKIPMKEWSAFLLSMLFAIAGWHIFTAYGVSQMPAGRASIIAFTMPVWAALFSSLILGERMTFRKILGLFFGLCGLAILMGPDIAILQQAPWGAFLMLCAAVSWAFGTVLFKKFSWQTPISVIVGWQLIVASTMMFCLALLLEPLPHPASWSTPTLIAMIYLIALPMIFCQWAYFKVVDMFPAAIASAGTLAVPIIGVYSSALILGEPVGWQEILALVFICSALGTVFYGPTFKRH